MSGVVVPKQQLHCEYNAGTDEQDADVLPAEQEQRPVAETRSPPAAGMPALNQPAVAEQPFGGRPPEEVLEKLVVETQRADGGFAIWGQELVLLWVTRLRPGQRIAFGGGGGVLGFLEAVMPEKRSSRDGGNPQAGLASYRDWLFPKHGLSLTCEISAEHGVQWFLTKESGQLPVVCEGFKNLVEPFPGVVERRPRPSLFVVKIVGKADQYEVLVVPFAITTVRWFEEFIAGSLLEAAREGNWKGVVHVVCFLLAKPPCLRSCSRCTCVEQLLWAAHGWRRVPVPELHVPNYIWWWRGVTDAAGSVGSGNKLWLKCPCGGASDT